MAGRDESKAAMARKPATQPNDSNFRIDKASTPRISAGVQEPIIEYSCCFNTVTISGGVLYNVLVLFYLIR